MVWLRRNVAEPEMYHAHRSGHAAGASHVWRVLRAPHLATTIKTTVLIAGAQGGSYALSVWLPTFLRTERGLNSLTPAPTS